MRVYIVFNCYDFVGVFSTHDKALRYIQQVMAEDKDEAEKLNRKPLYSLNDFDIQTQVIDEKETF